MFKNKKTMNPSNTDTLIGEESSVEGNISSKASLRIDGEVVGDILCEGDVTIGVNGIANSNITARNILNAGKIQGSVSSKGILTITNTGKMYGNIAIGSLSIAEGGVFQGMSIMHHSNDATQSETKKAHTKPHLVEKTKESAARG